VFSIWTDYRNGDLELFAQHVLPTGDNAPGWPVNGLPVVTGDRGQYFPQIVADGHGGFYASYEFDSQSPHVHVQHIGPDGQAREGWGPEGVSAAAIPGSVTGETAVCTDGAGGVIVVWLSVGGNLFAQRMTSDLPVAVELSLVSAAATSEGVRLEWRAPAGGIASASLERRSASEAWARIAHLVPDGEQRFRHEDGDVTPGERYAYRLVHAGGTTSEAWVEVPRAAVFALAGARPNPAPSSDLRVAFSLASAGAAELSLYDVSGRRVASRAVGSLGAGSHVVRLAEGERLEPGLYWLRLAQGAERRTARVVVAE
jgi:hypothetical protein